MKLELILILVILFSIILRSFLLHPTFSDESFYFNVGKNILEGKVPYKNFFFAHPPLQVYTLAALFGIFGTSFMVGKILTLISSTLCVLLLYFISKELFDKKTAFVTAIIFLITPAFLAFSSIGHGMWETTFLVLLSVYFLVKNKPFFSGLTLVIAIFFRYWAAIYFPFFLLFLHLRKKKFKKFSIYFLVLFLFVGVAILSIFSLEYLNQTVLYHIHSKVLEVAPKTQEMQYWGMGYFFLFLSLISCFVAYTKKDKMLLLFSVTPLVADMLILLGLKLIFYHYFLISLAFYVIAISRAFFISSERIVKVMIPTILFLSIFSNTKTLDFYLNPSYAEKYYYITEFVRNNTSDSDCIFGEPVITNYVSFVTGRKIAGNYLDSYLRHLIFEGEERVMETLKKEKPMIFIEMTLGQNYYQSSMQFQQFLLGYEFKEKVSGIPSYSLYLLK